MVVTAHLGIDADHGHVFAAESRELRCNAALAQGPGTDVEPVPTEKVKRCITCWEFPLFVSFEAPDRNGAFPWCSAEAEYTAVIGAAPREQLFRSVRLNTKRLRDRECTYLANFGASHGVQPLIYR